MSMGKSICFSLGLFLLVWGSNAYFAYPAAIAPGPMPGMLWLAVGVAVGGMVLIGFAVRD